MDNATKALSLATIGIKVFPVFSGSKAPAIEGGHGCYDATTDPELIATWFTLDYVGDDYAVAVWAGGSGLLTLDIDKKGDKDGFKSLEDAGLGLGSTYSYPTKNGGVHHVFATDDPELTIGKDVKVGGERLNGVDVRAGGGYFVWWADEVPGSREVLN